MQRRALLLASPLAAVLFSFGCQENPLFEPYPICAPGQVTMLGAQCCEDPNTFDGETVPDGYCEGSGDGTDTGMDADAGPDVGLDADADPYLPPDADADTPDMDAGPMCDGGQVVNGDGVCVECLTGNECGDPALSVCVDGTCVECDSSNTGAERDTSCQGIDGPRDFCGQNNNCVECLPGAAPGDEPEAGCLTGDAPVCGADNTCGACTTDDDCRRFAGAAAATGTPSCGPAGACVQCTPSDAEFACSSERVPGLADGAFAVCDPAMNTCTAIAAQSADRCESCTFDAQCAEGDACVEVISDSVSEGTRCIPRTDAAGMCNELGYPDVVTRTSVDGTVAEDFCSVDEALASCAAVLQRRADTPCAMAGSATSCGVPRSFCAGSIEGAGAAGGLCTYRCTARSCEPGYICQAAAGTGIPGEPNICVKS